MRKGRLCIALMALTLLFVGCKTPDENSDWSPGEDFPDWTYDKPVYVEPVDDLQPLETVGNEIPVYYSRNDMFFVRHPVKQQEDVRPRLAVWASDDAGLTWRKNGHYGLYQKFYTFASDHDARYWIRFVGPGVDPKTAEVPPGQPHRVYVVDTEAPEIFIRLDPPPLECECVCNCTGKEVDCAECDQAEQEEWTSYGATNPRACQRPQNEAFYKKCSVKTLCKHREARPHIYHVGDRVTVHWTINDMNVKPDTIELSTCFANFPHNLVWSRFKDTLPTSGSMEVIIPPEAVLQSGMRFRVVAEDKAGNVGLAMSEIMQVEETATALEAPSTAETATAPEPEEEIEPAAEVQPKSQQLFKVSAPTTSSRPTPPPPTDLTEPIQIEKPATPAQPEPAPEVPPAPETKPTPAIEVPTTLSSLAETQESQTAEPPTTKREAPLMAPVRPEEAPSPATPAPSATVEEPRPAAEPAPVVAPAPTPSAEEPKPVAAEPAPVAPTTPVAPAAEEVKPAPTAEKPAPAAEEKPSIPSVAVMEQKAPPAAPVAAPEPQKQPAEEKAEATKPRPEKLGIQPVKPTEPLAMVTSEPTAEPILKPAGRPSTAPTTMKLSDIPEKVQQGWPVQGTTLRGGMSRLLNWLPASVGEYKNAELQFSSNGGETWTTVAKNLKPGRAIMWTVPAATSKNCLLRVVGLDAEGKSTPLETSETFNVDTGEWETIDMSGFRMEVPKPK